MKKCGNNGKTRAIACGCVILSVLSVFFFAFFDDSGNTKINNEELSEFDGEWTVSVNQEERKYGKLPSKVAAKVDETIVLKNTLPTQRAQNEVVMFRSSQARVRVLIDGLVVHSYAYDSGFKKMEYPIGSGWQIFRVPEIYDGKEISIELSSPYRRYSGVINPVYLGTKSAAVFYIIEQGMVRILVGLILLVMGLAWCINAVVSRKSADAFRWWWLGLFITSTAIWLISETRMMQLFFDHAKMFTAITFCSLMILPLTFLSFLRETRHFKNDKVIKWLIGLCITNFALVSVLQFCNILDYIHTMVFTHVVFVVCMTYVIGNLTVNMVHHRLDTDSKVVFFGLLYLIAFSGFDMICLYMSPTYNVGWWSCIGIVVFSIITSIWNIKAMAVNYTEKIETLTLRKMAYTDILTGLPNRNAYEKQLSEYLKGENRSIVICNLDMNDLKQINDVHGHRMGDQAIKIMAQAMRSRVADSGYCFRVGGDEFIIILEDMSLEQACQCVEEIQQDINENAQAKKFKLTMAYGIINCNTGTEGELEKALKMSDVLMYERKAKMKAEMNTDNARK